MTDPTKWTKEIAIEIAKDEGITLTDKHFEVLNICEIEMQKGRLFQ